MNRVMSENGRAMTRSFEGLRLHAYQDAAGVWTVGYGHTGPDVRAGLCVDHERACELLCVDMAWAERCVNDTVLAPLTQGQFDALVDFCFNAGAGALRGSDLLRLVNARAYARAAEEFTRWCHVNGVVCEGLLRRRQAESAMFSASSS